MRVSRKRAIKSGRLVLTEPGAFCGSHHDGSEGRDDTVVLSTNPAFTLKLALVPTRGHR